MRWFNANFGSIMMDFLFFCRDCIEGENFTLQFWLFWGGTDQIHASGTAFRHINGWMAIDVRAL